MYDIIIIGAGPAGMSAAIYGQRAGKKTLLLDEKSFGGQIINTPEVENYPAIAKISGVEFANQLYEQTIGLGAEIAYEKAIKIEKKGKDFIVETESNSYEGKSIIIATGAKNRPLGIEKEEKFVGAGISYCATCDGAFFRNKEVAVIGGGNTALEDAEVLSNICKKVYLVHRRDAFRGDETNVKRLTSKENVELVLDSVVKELQGDMTISGIKVENVKTKETRDIEVNGVFVAMGQIPDNKNFANLAGLDDKGYVLAGEECLTNTPGVFTAGDCRTKKVRQLTTAASDGAVAALAAVEYINAN